MTLAILIAVTVDSKFDLDRFSYYRGAYEPKIEKDVLLRVCESHSETAYTILENIQTNGEEYQQRTRNTRNMKEYDDRTRNTQEFQRTRYTSPARPGPPPQQGSPPVQRPAPASGAASTQPRNTSAAAAVTPAPTTSSAETPAFSPQELEAKQDTQIADALNEVKHAKAMKLNGASNWEVVLPDGIDLSAHIEPYADALKDLLEVQICIEDGRLFVGNVVLPPMVRPPAFVNPLILQKRATAMDYFLEYSQECIRQGVALDIMNFMGLKRFQGGKETVSRFNQKAANTSKADILWATVHPPSTPTPERMSG